MQNISRDTEKTMRVAFIGVAPSEKVILKGYFSFLFRSSIAFQWRAGNEGDVDLYLINDGFRGSSAVQRMSEGNIRPHGILYVSHDKSEGAGYVKGNAIKLPLHNLDALKRWMEQNLPLLGGDGVSRRQAEKKEIRTKATVSSLVDGADDLSEMLARFIKTLHKRNDKVYDFYVDNRRVGCLHSGERKLWLNEEPPFGTGWDLRVADGMGFSQLGDGVDVMQWIWTKVMDSPEHASSVIGINTPVALKNWFKPAGGEERKDLIRIFTVLRKRECTVTELAEAIGIELSRAHVFVAALLICGSLYVAPDRMLSVRTHSEIGTFSDSVSSGSRSRGFLSRFRKKLGL